MILSRSNAALIIFTERGNSSTNSLKTRPEKARRTPGIFSSSASELRLREILQGHLAQTFLAEQAEVNRGHERVQGFVRADVRCGLLAADVLFAGGERQHETTAAGSVGGLASEPARHLADKLFACRDDAHERSAVARRDTEGLTFEGHDVGFGGRANDAERNSFGDGRDEQGSASSARHRRAQASLRALRRNWVTAR